MWWPTGFTGNELMPRFSLYPVGGHWLVVIAVAAVLVGLLWVKPHHRGLTPRRRAVLTALRLAVVALVVLVMLRPTWVYTKTIRQSATLILLADATRSLSVRDEAGGRSRYELLRQTLQRAAERLDDLAARLEVKAYAFASKAQPVEVEDGRVQLPESPEGDQTAIGAVLDDVLAEQLGKRVVGIVLLSDGAQRAYPPRDLLPQTVASRLKQLGYPVFTIRFGKSRGIGQAQDVAVTSLVADQRVFVKTQLTVTGEVRAFGYVNRPLNVRLLAETAPGKLQTVDQRELTVTSDGQRVPVEFTYVPQTPGEVKIVLEVEPRPGELVSTNNRRSTFVRVLGGGIRVLYLEGELRREIAAIRNALGQSPEIDVDYVRIDHRRPETRPADLGEKLKPGQYDVYILGDLDASVFRPGELQDLADAVAAGAGLIMIGGFHSFGPGGYAQTPLDPVLPVQMDRLERQPLDGEVAPDLHLPACKIVPTQAGLIEFTLRLAPTVPENQALWARLPPLEGANRFRGCKDRALVLATDGQGHPLLARQAYGRGRVLAFAGDSTWRWPLKGFDLAHMRFWRQVVLWLARKDESLEGNVWIKLARRQFEPGNRVEFPLGAQTASGEPVQGASFQVEVVLPDRSVVPVSPIYSERQAVASFHQTRQPGDYLIRVTGTKDGELLGSTQARFLVLDQDLELDNPSADAALMESLASITGGQSLAPEELPELLQSLAEKTDELEVRTETKQSLWDKWSTFLLLVGLLGLEWYLRKRWGLV
ncbi:MAG TPA: hypothetical protein EYH34_12230 [Planctomycetes bacterium]|nr:hypothetical protein [Planctomycetota bacterium]